MNKSLLFSAAFLAVSASMSADITEVKNLYSGEQAVTWENTLTIDAAEFTDEIKIGNYISISLENATNTLEIKGNGVWLPGSRYCPIEGATEYKAYITTGMLAALREYGLEICGASFTVKSVSIMDDGFQMPADAIWGGYFWVENWNALEIGKTAFDNYNGERYMIVNLSDDNGDNTGYFMKAMTTWNEADIWADNSAITHNATNAVIDLQDVNVATTLEATDRVMIQSNPEGGNPFNITSVVLSQTPSAAIKSVEAADEASEEFPAKVYNLQGIAVATVSDTSEVSLLPAGLYLLNGKKVAVR